MSNIPRLKHIKNALSDFIIELQNLAESVESENDFNNILVNEVAPMITVGDRVYGVSIFHKLDLAVELSLSAVDSKSNSLQASMHYMNNSAICELLDIVWSANKALPLLTEIRNGYKVDPERAEDAHKHLSRQISELQSKLNSELFERIDEQTWEIKKLRGEN